jgi:hypothetical protein
MEQNTAEFQVERSVGNENFEKIGTIDAAGFSQTTRYYRFEDPLPEGGMAYYRIKQIDRDGKYSYSEICKIENTLPLAPNLYPNPCTDFLQISGLEKLNSLDYRLYSTTGMLIGCGKLENSKLSVKDLPEGVYALKISTAAGEWNLRFAKVQ